MSEPDDPPQYSWEWWWQPPKNSDEPVRPGMGFVLTVLVVVTFIYLVNANVASVAYFRPAEVMICGLLGLILWRLGEIAFLLNKRLK